MRHLAMNLYWNIANRPMNIYKYTFFYCNSIRHLKLYFIIYTQYTEGIFYLYSFYFTSCACIAVLFP